MKISRAPFRVSFFGGGTDFKEWYEIAGTTVITCSIDRFCYISIRQLLPFYGNNLRISWSKLESINNLEEISHPAIRECLRFKNIEKGVEIHTDGDLPARSGLGSSSTFSVALLHACNVFLGRKTTTKSLAEEAIYLEQVLLKESVGVQDQIQACYGGFNIIRIKQDGSFVVFNLMQPSGLVERINNNLVLVYSGIQRFSSEVHKEIQNRGVTHRKHIEGYLEEIAAMSNWAATKIFNDVLSYDDFCDLLNKSWAAKASIIKGSEETDILNSILAMGIENGAQAGKVMGGGGGGFLAFMVSEEKKERFKDEMYPYICIDPSFSRRGVESIK